MSKNLIIFNLFIFLFKLCLITSFKYPIFNNITNSETENIRAILIKSQEQYLNYIIKEKYVIALTEYSIYEKEPKIISIFNKLSSYKLLKDWVFLHIQCYQSNDLCNLLSANITNKTFPSIKIYIKSQEIKTSDIIYYFDINDFFQMLLRLSNNPIVEIKNNDINNFYEKYSKYSPIIYYNKQKSEFISCINLLARKKYFPDFYFGVIPMNNLEVETKKEKIIFDNYGMPISMTWEGDCDDIDIFLGKNTYPLISKIDNQLINQLSLDKKILFVLYGYSSNSDKINKFINNEFKKLAYVYRDLVFAFDFYNENNDTKFLIDKTGFRFNARKKSTIKVMFYNFADELYYIYPIVYILNNTNTDLVYNRINHILERTSTLPFTCGNLFIDIMRKTRIYKFFKDTNKMTTLGFTAVIIILGFLYLCICGKRK